LCHGGNPRLVSENEDAVRVLPGQSECENKENTPPSLPIDTSTNQSKDAVDSKFVDSKKPEQDTNNMDKSDSVTSDTGCVKCIKRRISDCDSEVEAAVDSISPKRLKTEFQTADKSTETVEPMQTESVQISNLVSCFSSGFSGLLAASREENCKNSDSIVSCSTQIKETFESLARPVIALTV